MVEATNRFDRLSVESMEQLRLSPEQLKKAFDGLSAEQRNALSAAAERIRRYHERQKPSSWQYEEADGTVLGQKVTPLDRAGNYAPGGKAAYPSSVLMNSYPCPCGWCARDCDGCADSGRCAE